MTRRKLYAYYYPAHHRSLSGWFEWDLVRNARPWFNGHPKPDRPLWGELDDTEPGTFVRQARAAHEAGLDGFVIDTWWRPDGATLYDEAWEQGILPALDRADFPPDFQVGTMWIPVWPRITLPIGMDEPSVAKGVDRLFPFTAGDLERLVEHLEPRLTHPKAIRIGGRPLLAIFHGWRLRDQLGAKLPSTLATIRSRYPGPCVAGVINQLAEAALLDGEGFDALTSYVWWPEWLGPARQDYRTLGRARRRDWATIRRRCATPYLPSVAAGWDSTPRGKRDWDGQRIGFPYTPVIEGNTPRAVADAVSRALRWLDRAGAPPDHPVMIASWNEWSESHRLEPCERLGTEYLDALARLRGRHAPATF